jgi:hypothetical protein
MPTQKEYKLVPEKYENTELKLSGVLFYNPFYSCNKSCVGIS